MWNHPNDHFGGLSPKSSKCSSPFLYMSGLNSINPHIFQLFSHPQWLVFPPLPCADSAPAPAQLPPWPWHPPLAAPASRAPPRPPQGCQQRSGGGWWGAPGVGDLSKDVCRLLHEIYQKMLGMLCLCFLDPSRCFGFFHRIYPHMFGFFMGFTNVFGASFMGFTNRAKGRVKLNQTFYGGTYGIVSWTWDVFGGVAADNDGFTIHLWLFQQGKWWQTILSQYGWI